MIKRHIGMLLLAGGFALASTHVAGAADPFTITSSSFTSTASGIVRPSTGAQVVRIDNPASFSSY